MTYKKRCNNCIHVLCDVVGRQRPERNIEFVCESIVLFEKCYGFEYKEETRELALDAISKYGPGTQFENDERMLPVYRILGKYSRSMSSTDLYDKLHEKGLFATSARFFVDWVEVHLLAHQNEKAKRILMMMEQAVGTEHVSCVHLSQRIRGEENQSQRPRENPGMSKIAALVKPSEAPTQPARRNLFGAASTAQEFVPTAIRKPKTSAEPIAEDHPMRSTIDPEPAFPPVRDEAIVLPNIVEAPPIDMSIVSPSINLIQSGQLPSNFSLPPVFSFSSSSSSSSSHTYKSSIQTSTNETTVIRNPVMSTSMMSAMNPPTMASSLSGLPSHPAQIGHHFAIPALPSFHADFTRQSENSENMDPRGASHYSARRDITGVLMPSKNFPIDPFGELEKEPVEKKSSSYEVKKARLQTQLHQQQSSAARRIFTDPTQPIENAFNSFGLDSPKSFSKH
ncbi:hypothetical protein PENTCL1PPCAC_28810 [Pristionchus entomophagus]|uniref:Uncharacterized protein n=1 Tax=Pristionchus entomophagus TaxID=358040 RepID=A0AAV5UJI9_9BILA|nr:hypothetical protein PENTCL1PPCAC_28810 [Pristionchus entomophagus]